MLLAPALVLPAAQRASRMADVRGELFETANPDQMIKDGEKRIRKQFIVLALAWLSCRKGALP